MQSGRASLKQGALVFTFVLPRLRGARGNIGKRLRLGVGMRGVMGGFGSVGKVDPLVGVACGAGVGVVEGIVESPGEMTS